MGWTDLPIRPSLAMVRTFGKLDCIRRIKSGGHSQPVCGWGGPRTLTSAGVACERTRLQVDQLRRRRRVHAGVLVGDRVFVAAALLADDPGSLDTSSILGLLRQWRDAHPRLNAAAAARVDREHGTPAL